jgi:hypothetical protein
MQPYASLTTHNPIAFAKCTKPPSARTHGELRPEMITYIFGFLSCFLSSGKSRENTHVKRLSKPGSRIMVEEWTASRRRVGIIDGVKRGGLRLTYGLLEHMWCNCGLEAQQRCERDIHLNRWLGTSKGGGSGSRVMEGVEGGEIKTGWYSIACFLIYFKFPCPNHSSSACGVRAVVLSGE